jgi:AcrR family transcriptional regulator
MARPQTDIDAGRRLLLDALEDLIRARGAVDISMGDLAAAAGMSPSNLYRFFESKEALFEAVAEDWFAAKIRVMEDVCASDLAVPQKLLAFFARRFELMVQQFTAEPQLFKSYIELGNLHFEVIRGYVDLGDHYLSMIVAEAMEQGFFTGLSIDNSVSLINQMVHPYVNPDAILGIGLTKLTVEKLGIIIDTILYGLGKTIHQGNAAPNIRIVS